MKVYKYDENGVFERDDLIFIEDGEELPEGYTTIAPPIPSINPVFDVEKQEWSDGDDPSTLKPAEPSEIEQLKQENADLLLQIAEVESNAESTQQDQADMLMTLVEEGVL
ncbi:hypothetical protein ACYRFT_01610 [Listeria kieliensis]